MELIVMNDIKDILNKMKFVPEELQDEVLKRIKESAEKEIAKSCNPLDLVIQRLEELNFGSKDSERDSEQDRRIIRMIIACLPCDWFDMKPVYCRSVKKTKEYDNWTSKWYENQDLDDILRESIRDYSNDNELDSIVYLFQDITDQCYHGDIDIKKDSVWLWRDGANGELWINTTQSFAKEMLYWFKGCMCKENEDDVECAYKLLNKLEKSFPKEE